jgi:hypothetical protein
MSNLVRHRAREQELSITERGIRVFKRPKSFLFLASMLGALAGAVLVPAQPASADTCGAPGCGGTVVNRSNRSVDVVNCWHNSSGSWTGNGLPPCAPYYSRYAHPAAYWVSPGGSSTGISNKYYDIDAFYAAPGCVTQGLRSGGGTFQYDRRGRAGLWTRIYGTETATVTYVIC